MMIFRRQWSLWLSTCCVLLAAVSGADSGDFEASLEDWKRQRVEFLKSADGYLNLVGLYWLREPQSSFGSAPGSDIRFPAGSPAHMGSFLLQGDSVILQVADEVEVYYRDKRVKSIEMRDDTMTSPVVVTSGSLAWTVIRRDRQFAVRLRDFEHPAIGAFPAIDYFPVDESLRVVAQLQPYDQPRVVKVNTVIEGLEYKPTSPGTVQFDIGGTRYDLEAYGIGKGLMFVFGDLTTGRQTYPAGRFLYADHPDDNGSVVLDFNRAENPPCAFNEFATCPVASPRNRLPIAVAVGERYDPAKHH
jgi:uncharacterized protein (DUF1684 family)